MPVVLLALLALAALAAPPLEDRRNTDTPHTDTHFTMPDYPTREAWETRARALRRQILFAAGLDPMPDRTPLRPQIFGRVERQGYSIEKVLLETMPGYFLGGNLFRPLGRTGKLPAVLSPHGHWLYGRVEHQPLGSVPTRAINLARQGYVVFTYDMVGYNDTLQTPHVFGGAREQLWGFGPLGLQLWNSIRAADFLESLPEVDRTRLGMTGASGGGTQTFLMYAVDSRIAYAAPVNMISAIMQGGSPCENAPGLRVGAFNVEIGALMAPKPLLMVSATGDWTRNTPREEYPAIRRIYELYGAGDQVETVLIDAPHNYNQASREAVYRFFAKHALGDAVGADSAKYREAQTALEPLQNMLAMHGRTLPPGALNYDQLFAQWVAAARRQTAAADPATLRQRLALALHAEWPAGVEHETEGERIVLGRPGRGDRVPGLWLPGESRTAATLLVHPEGAQAARATAEAKARRRAGRALLALDVFQTGAARAPRDRSHRFFLTFNVSDDAARVQDILTGLAWLRQTGYSELELVGLDKASLWAVFAAALTPDRIALEADTSWFAGDDEAFVLHLPAPGIQRAGGLEAARRARP